MGNVSYDIESKIMVKKMYFLASLPKPLERQLQTLQVLRSHEVGGTGQHFECIYVFPFATANFAGAQVS